MEVLIMTKRELYEMIANLIDIIVIVFMLTFVNDVLTGDAFDLIIDGVTILAFIGLENILKFVIKISDDIED